MKKEYFSEMGFRGLTLIFWTIIIYGRLSIRNFYIDKCIFLIFNTLAILYIIIIGILQIKNKFLDNIVIYYKFSTLISYILTVTSYLIYQTNITLIFLKAISVFIYFYISSKCVFKFKDTDCVVGIISSILLITI